MPKVSKKRTPEQMIESMYMMTLQIRRSVKREHGRITLSDAMAKRLFQALHTVTLYLHQPEKVRQNQIDRIIDVRDALESEYKEQTGKAIEQ